MVLSEKEIKDALSEVYDPEIAIDIVSLGLIYNIDINSENDVKLTMTLTFPGCPYGPAMLEEIEDKLKEIPTIRNVVIDLTFEPPWTPESMDPDIRAALNFH
ncbi:MAG: metal-sulfur cluster assembly factor [Candidatus Woesearchaeota archaeon]|jgi:metal-sulfur cluster biosynthetic enzyme